MTIVKKFLYVLSIISIFIIIISTKSFASPYPKLISTLQDAFDTIQTWLLALATPAAGISVATGAFMKKFRDDEKIRTGKKLIRTALISYIFIILLRLILTTISNLLSS
jgi:uncharacterized membrane protein YadS